MSYLFYIHTDSSNNENMLGLGKIFKEKYLLTFYYGTKTIGYYYGIDEKKNKKFDVVKNGFYVLLILMANILVIFSFVLCEIINKCTKSKVDPTIRMSQPTL